MIPYCEELIGKYCQDVTKEEKGKKVLNSIIMLNSILRGKNEWEIKTIKSVEINAFHTTFDKKDIVQLLIQKGQQQKSIMDKLLKMVNAVTEQPSLPPPPPVVEENYDQELF